MKIIAFTFAGGNKYSFRKFAKMVPDFVVIEYSGRGSRIAEELLSDIEAILDDLLTAVEKEINSCDTYAIYGHSMGALIGYLMCHKILELQLKNPEKLIVTGKKSPNIEKEDKIAGLPDAAFWEEVIKIGGIPDELLEYPEVVDFYLPILKSDFAAIENYSYRQKKKLNIPIDVFYGHSEKISDQEVIEWENESTQNVNITKLKGNHFFIFNNDSFFTEYFREQINTL